VDARKKATLVSVLLVAGMLCGAALAVVPIVHTASHERPQGCDPRALRVPATKTTVDRLRRLHPPRGRAAGASPKVFRVRARLARVSVVGGRTQLVVSDPAKPAVTLIAELLHGGCKKATPLAKRMRKARAALLAACGISRNQASIRLDGEATITGVADARRDVKGKSVRLSPVLDFRAIRCAQITGAAVPPVPVAAGSVPASHEPPPEPQPEPEPNCHCAGPARSINVAAFSNGDQLMTHPALQNFLRAHGVLWLRIPNRPGLNYQKLLNAVKNSGARPLPIAVGSCSRNLAMSDRILDMVDATFPGVDYWVEYGNENDLQCSRTKETYTQSWNEDISQLKPQHPRAKFVGPVIHQWNSAYVNYFLRKANPQPDAVSWHEYACGSSDSDQDCFDHIQHWTTHLNRYDTLATSVGYRPPVLITEWNLDPFDDVRYTTPSFIQPWTRRALAKWESEIAAGRVATVFQYPLAAGSATGGFQLFKTDDSLTLQGQAFFGQ
jgi:hypothetical protein